MKKRACIYTDGSFLSKTACGGWAAFVTVEGGKQYTLQKASRETTNNRMEITAALQALKSLKTPHEVMLYSDSEYVVNAIRFWIQGWAKRGWRKSDGSPVKNSDLFKELKKQLEFHVVTPQWVKAHAGILENELVDDLARSAASSPEKYTRIKRKKPRL